MAMTWVRLTRREDDEYVYVNLERFDFVIEATNATGHVCANVVSIIGEDYKEVYEIHVWESPNEIFKMVAAGIGGFLELG
jgi:hypothetical protein